MSEFVPKTPLGNPYPLWGVDGGSEVGVGGRVERGEGVGTGIGM